MITKIKVMPNKKVNLQHQQNDITDVKHLFIFDQHTQLCQLYIVAVLIRTPNRSITELEGILNLEKGEL